MAGPSVSKFFETHRHIYNLDYVQYPPFLEKYYTEFSFGAGIEVPIGPRLLLFEMRRSSSYETFWYADGDYDATEYLLSITVPVSPPPDNDYELPGFGSYDPETRRLVEDASFWRVGVFTGIHDPRYAYATDQRSSWIGGAKIERQVAQLLAVDLRLSLSPQLVRKVGTFMSKGTGLEPSEIYSELSWWFVQIPLHAKFAASSGSVRLFVSLGPRFDVRVSESLPGGRTGIENDIEFNTYSLLQLDVDIAAGTGIQIGHQRYFVQTRYELDVDSQDYILDQPDAHGLAITAGVTVPLKL